MTRTAFAAAALGIASLSLAACDRGTEAEVAAPEGVPGLEITNGRMVLPAVADRPAAVYFDLAYNADRGLSLTKADVAGAARAELHEYSNWQGEMRMGESGPLPLTNGTTITFEPGGRHVMAFDVSPELTAGGTTEVTLFVSGGDKTSFPVTIQSAGEER